MKVKTLNKKIKTLIKNLVIISIEMYIQDSWRTEIARLNIFIPVNINCLNKMYKLSNFNQISF